MAMKAGDVLLFHADTSWSGFLKKPWGVFSVALIHWATKSRWNHAAIAVSSSVYAEATSDGVMLTPFGHTHDQIKVFTPPYKGDEDRMTAVAWAHARAGEPYGYLNAIACGVNEITVGLGFVIKQTNAIICSELVAEALERAGFDFGKDSALVSPGDLATKFGVVR
jgi:uncharacterized protein YycO